LPATALEVADAPFQDNLDKEPLSPRSPPMAANDLAAGKLVALSEITITLGEPYCFVYPKSKPAILACSS
jgi:hypothetical protein